MSKQFFNRQKTLIGSGCFFVTAAAVCFGWLHFGYHFPVADIIKIDFIVTMFTTAMELITLHGKDNRTVPPVTMLILELF